MAASKSTVKEVKDMEAIASGLARTVLGNNAVNTDLAVETSVDMEAIANRLGETVLEEDETVPEEGDKQSLANLPAAKEKAAEENGGEAGLEPAGTAKKQAAEKEEEGIDALGAAWSDLSLENADELEAQRLREQVKKQHQDKMKALENAEAKRQADEEFSTFMRQFQADIDGAKVKKIKRKARKEKDEEAARQLRLAAEAEEIALAERRAQQERRMQEEAQAAQAKRESDDRARLELSQIYNRIFADAAIAHANAQEAQRQRQRREAELIAQYHAAVARQAQIAELERRQQEELFLQQHLAQHQLAQQQLAQQHHSYPQGEQVSEGTEEMETAPEGGDLDGTEMDTAPEMEASGGTEMDWEQMEEKTPLLAEPLLLLPQSTELLTQGASSHASTVAGVIAAPPSAAGPNTADSNQQPATLATARPIEANVATATPATAEAAAIAEAEPPAPASAPAIVLRLPPHAATPPPPPAPLPAPIPSGPKTIKIFFKRGIPNPTHAALRPTISAWSPLGRLLSQQKSIPQVALPQVLGKRGRQDWEDGGRDRKQAKLEGEFRFEVGGKRKREDESFPGKKRALCNRRALVVPCSRLAASSVASANNAAPPPTLPPTATPPNALPAPAPSPPSQPPPPSAAVPLPTSSHRDLAEARELYNDLPTLRAEIAWMRAQRLNTSRKETRGKDIPSHKTTVTRTPTPASYWSRYRENLSR